MKTIGITSTIPAEVPIAAGYRVIDLNNLFVGSPDYGAYIEEAERDGFPGSSCAWIKGIYGACLANGITEVVGITQGDCSNSTALMDVLDARGVKVYPFAYPLVRTYAEVKKSIRGFMEMFGVRQEEAEAVRQELNSLRAMAREVDRLTWRDNKASGFENHLYQVMQSDFGGDAAACGRQLEEKIAEIAKRPAKTGEIRLGYIGVPPMMTDLYAFAERQGARVAYNEVQREFAFPRFDAAGDIYAQYCDYTYPYSLDFRLREIIRQVEERSIDGVIHYTQAFCHRGIEDIVMKKKLAIPVLAVEGDNLNTLDARTKLRLEIFIDMLRDRKRGLV